MVVEGFGSLKRTTLGKELRENRIYRALYSYTDADGVVQLLLTSHVDDLLWACDSSCDIHERTLTRRR